MFVCTHFRPMVRIPTPIEDHVLLNKDCRVPHGIPKLEPMGLLHLEFAEFLYFAHLPPASKPILRFCDDFTSNKEFVCVIIYFT